jgi:hypothetical protein
VVNLATKSLNVLNPRNGSPITLRRQVVGEGDMIRDAEMADTETKEEEGENYNKLMPLLRKLRNLRLWFMVAVPA